MARKAKSITRKAKKNSSMLAYFYLWIERSFGDINFYFPVEQINIEA